jgi:hypothetical protein
MRSPIILVFSIFLIFLSACGISEDLAATKTSVTSTEDVLYETETLTITQTPTHLPTRTPRPNLGSTRSDIITFMEALGCFFDWDQHDTMAGTCSPETEEIFPNLLVISITLDYLYPGEYVYNTQVCSTLRNTPTPQDRQLISFYMKSLAIAATPLWREGEQWVYDNVQLIGQENPTIEKPVGRFTAAMFWQQISCTDVPDCQLLCFRLSINQK